MEEEWRPIEEFENRYEVSNKGRVRTIGTWARVCGNGKRFVKGKLLSIGKYPNGYAMVNLSSKDRRVTRLVHRLVAQAFIPNPDNLPQVNHKDEDITNNNVENLEWCTPAYNANYGTRNYRSREGHRMKFKPVLQISKETGEIIKRWDCINDAAREIGICGEVISRACRGIFKAGGGFYWKFAKEEGIEG